MIRAILVSIVLLTVAGGTVYILGPGRFQAVSLSVVHNSSPGLPVIPSSGQGIYGYISIGPVSPLCSNSNPPVPSTILSVLLVVRSHSDGVSSNHEVNWMQSTTCNFLGISATKTAPGPAALGTFRVDLPASTYDLTLSTCSSSPNQPGCRQMPIIVTVPSWSYVRMDLAFDTGIR